MYSKDTELFCDAFLRDPSQSRNNRNAKVKEHQILITNYLNLHDFVPLFMAILFEIMYYREAQNQLISYTRTHGKGYGLMGNKTPLVSNPNQKALNGHIKNLIKTFPKWTSKRGSPFWIF